MNNLYEALEVCLESIDHGMDIETSLARYPDIADDLRPILEASANARAMAVSAPSPDVVWRNRAKFLQRTAEMREAQVQSSSTRNWFNLLRRATVALTVLAIVFMSGTGLVRASSNTLPGDNLYPVKRTWEDVSLLFTFDVTRREALEIEHENNRLQEVQELFAKGRSAEVDFAGIVTRQDGEDWLVSGVRIIISSQTDLHDGPVFVEDAVRVFGVIQSDGSVLVERIDQLPSGAKLPSIGNSGKGSEGESSGSERQSFEGVLNSMNGTLWSINGLTMNVSIAEIKGSPTSGDIVKVEGYFDSAGVFIATKIEVLESDSHSGSGSNDNSNNNANDSSVSGNDNSNHNNSGSDSGAVNDNSSGSGGGNDNGNDSNSGPGSNNNSSTEDNSSSGSGSDNSNDSNSGPGGGDG